MKARGAVAVSKVLVALEQLDDEELLAVIARAQGLLLDRPIPVGVTPALAVEVVGREESHLLAAYRALAPLAQRRLLRHVVHLVHTSRRLGRRLKPAAAAPARVTAALLPRARHTVAR